MLGFVGWMPPFFFFFFFFCVGIVTRNSKVLWNFFRFTVVGLRRQIERGVYNVSLSSKIK